MVSTLVGPAPINNQTVGGGGGVYVISRAPRVVHARDCSDAQTARVIAWVGSSPYDICLDN